MLDIQLLRKDLANTINLLQKRKFNFNQEYFIEIETLRKNLQIDVENLQAKRNALSKQVGMAKAQKLNCDELIAQVNLINQEFSNKNIELENIQKNLHAMLAQIPNIPDETVPIGNDENDNKIIKIYGEPTKHEFAIKDHVDLGEKFGLDFALGTKLAGTRFVVLKNQIAKLHRALAQFMLDTHTANNYQEIYVPYLVNAESMYGTGQLPKFESDLFKVPLENSENNSFYLIPTAEVPITNMLRQELIKEQELPLKFVAHTPCFRSEAGSYGRDTRGLIRQHQFDKVELVHIVAPKNSNDALEELTTNAESILRMLEIPYRKLLLCTGDMGFGSAKTYDLEAWIPAQNTYREISSCSNMKDFQARRMQARFKNTNNEINFVHTLSGSALAVGRTLVAILENFQNKDGSISIPGALRSYCGFNEIK